MGYHGAYIRPLLTSLLTSLLILSHTATAISWRGRGIPASVREQSSIPEPVNSASQLLQIGTREPTSYEIALHELQELESEPLCHRTAARLLVNNCQLLEGKDDATVLTDSGRQIRDFVDSYAASLAICDLERGRFVIPTGCKKFQEPTLSQLPIRNAALLHVTSAEIDGCLSALGTSDSAWNTWISYRHKALRFCEAARADNDKDQNIILFQRLAKIMTRLADDLEVKQEQLKDNFNLHNQVVEENIEILSPLFGKLQHDLEYAGQTLTNHLLQEIEKSRHQVNSGLESAEKLERVLQVIIQGVLNGHAEAAAMHSQSLQLMSRTSSEMDIMVSGVKAAVAATASIQNELEVSRTRSMDLESRQDNLELGMQRLLDISDTLAGKYDAHTDLLQQAQNITNEIFDTLKNTAVSAAAVRDGFLGQSFLKSWWLYIWCPVVSLVMGSYGLPPSAIRNVGLIALGETAGFVISSFSFVSFDSAHKLKSLQTPDTKQDLANLTFQIKSH